MKTGLKVSDIMVKDVISVKSKEKIIDCARKMKRKRVGSLIILDGDYVVGIVTEQDIVRRATAEAIDLNLPIRKVMSINVQLIEPDLDLVDAVNFMEKNDVRHLPVVKDDKLIGIITFKDIMDRAYTLKGC